MSVDRVAVLVFYETSHASTETHSSSHVVLAGGFALSHFSDAAASSVEPPPDAKEVHVGRGPARQWTLQATATQWMRLTRWIEGSTVMLLMTAVDKHTDADVRRFVDSLRPV